MRKASPNNLHARRSNRSVSRSDDRWVACRVDETLLQRVNEMFRQQNVVNVLQLSLHALERSLLSYTPLNEIIYSIWCML